MSVSSGPETEDSLSFTSAIFGALGSTFQQQSSPKLLLLGLVFASVSKALPSLGSPEKRKKKWLEDSILFLAAILAYLGAGIESNFSFTDNTSQAILVVGLAIALIGKAVPSLIKKPRKLEDWVPFFAALASAIAILPFNTQYAEVGIFFGFLGKQLLSSPEKTN